MLSLARQDGKRHSYDRLLFTQCHCFNTFPVFLSGHQYSKVRRALHSSYPDNLLCREKEITEIRSFLQNHLPKGKPGSLYISGAPGTGKTACLTKIMLEMKVPYCCSLQIHLVYNHLSIFYFFIHGNTIGNNKLEFSNKFHKNIWL